MSSGTEQAPTVFIVDDDRNILNAMQFLLKSAHLPCAVFASGEAFLESFDPERPGCLVLDIRMPGVSGLELQERLRVAGSTLPIIFVTGHADVPMAVEAMQKGAFDFVQKPFREKDLLERIRAALTSNRRARDERARRAEVQARLRTLTTREREVMELVVTGKPNKVIAHELGVSQRTVEIHRARVMDKMQARSLADLVRMSL
jgi:RNA polymerase sigma factor (sigma-70 family)